VLFLFRAIAASRLILPHDQSGDGGPQPLGLRPIHAHPAQQMTVGRQSLIEVHHALLHQRRVVVAEAAVLKE